MVLGILSILGAALLLVPPLLAVIFGHISLSKIGKDSSLSGKGMGIAGLVMGYVCIVPVLLIGVMSAMAIPAFNEVRETAQEKAIINNTRMIASAADQYFLEEGVTSVALEKLYEAQYLTPIIPVDDETYPEVITLDQQIRVTREFGETIIYPSE